MSTNTSQNRCPLNLQCLLKKPARTQSPFLKVYSPVSVQEVPYDTLFYSFTLYPIALTHRPKNDQVPKRLIDFRQKHYCSRAFCLPRTINVPPYGIPNQPKRLRAFGKNDPKSSPQTRYIFGCSASPSGVMRNYSIFRKYHCSLVLSLRLKSPKSISFKNRFFISRDLANKILVTGKSINFLREVCQDKIPIKGKEDLKQCFETNGQDLFSLVPDTKLHMLIDTVYLNTSKRVLDIAMGPHKLLQHLQAMRNYLLLGQGDFIGILLENLK